MIEGITVLSQTPIIYQPAWALLAIIVSLFGFIILTAYTIAEERLCSLLGAILVGAGCLALFITTCNGKFDVDTGRCEYKCTIAEDVSLTEVVEQYEITGQDGDIWILEDKE